MWINNGFAQQNALTLRIDTVTVKFGTKDTLVPIYFGIQGIPNTSFRGYDSFVGFDASKLGDSLAVPASMRDSTGRFDTATYAQYVDSTIGARMFNGTASATLPPLFALLRGEIRAIELCVDCPGIDTTKKLLYRVYLTMHSVFSDTAALRLFRFDQTSGQPFDTVILQDGWIRYARSPLRVTSLNSTVQSDSTVTVPVIIGDVTTANLREGLFSCTIDTSVLKFVRSLPGSIPGNSLVTSDSVSGDRIVVRVSNNDTTKPLVGKGTLLNLQFRAISRTDTICTLLRDSAFSATNSDALVSTVTLAFGGICVDGHIPQGVQSRTLKLDEALEVWPNPFGSDLNIRIRNGQNVRNMLEVYDALGRNILKQTFGSDGYVWHPESSIQARIYYLRVSSTLPGNTQGKLLEQEVLLIH